MIIRLSFSRMLAGSLLIVAVATLLASSAGHAFSLGEMKLQSALGQPLRLSIPIVNSRDEEIGSDCFRLVSPAASGDAIPGLVTARVSLERAASGDRLLITTRAPVNEPVVQLAVSAQCRLSLQREYTLLLDPPVSVQGGTALAAYEEAITPTLATRRRSQAAESRTRTKASALAKASTPASSKAITSAALVTPVDTGAAAGSKPAAIAANGAGAAGAAPIRVATPGRAAPTPVRDVPIPITATSSALANEGAASASTRAASPSPVSVAIRDNARASTDAAPATQLGSLTAGVAPRILPISSAGATSITRPRAASGTSALAPSSTPEQSLWESALPAAASFAAGGVVVLAGLALRRRHLARAAPRWSSTAKATGQGLGNAPATDLDTFAHFAAVTEANFNTPGAQQSSTFERHEPSLETASLDTLLGELDADAVEERALRKAWAQAQSGLEDNPGSSGAILKAIADAERELSAADISYQVHELEVDLDDHIIAEGDSLVRPLRKSA